MKKRILSTLLILSMILTLLPLSALAAGPDSGSCGAGVQWSYDGAGTLTISGSGKISDYEHDWEKAPAPWWGYRTEITTVVVEQGITRIGNEAFGGGPYRDGYPKLKTVLLGASVREIGMYAFSGAGELKTLDLPASLTRIESNAFAFSALETVTLPAGVDSVDESAFANCWNLKAVQVASGNARYLSDGGALYECSVGNEKKLLLYPAQKTSSSYSVLSGTTETVERAFAWNEYLTAVTIPSSLKELPDLAFLFCTSLNSVSLPEGMTSVSSSAFWGCVSLRKLEIPSTVRSCITHYYPADDWIGMETEPLAVYFKGSAAPEFDGGLLYTRMDPSAKVTIYYPEYSTGWGAIQNQEDINTAKDMGLVEFKTWTPGEPVDPPDPPETSYAKIKRLTPANGAENVGCDAADPPRFEIVFDRPISANDNNWAYLDFEAGTFAIYRRSDNALIYEAKDFSNVPGLGTDPGTNSNFIVTGTSSTLLIRPTNQHILLEPRTEYYIVMDEGFIKFQDGSVSPAIEKGDWTFTTKVVDTDGFTLGIDNNSYSHSGGSSGGFYGVTDYSMSTALYNRLVQGTNSGFKDHVKTQMQQEWGGSCYGIAATIGLVYSGFLDVSDITSDRNAESYYTMPLPYKDTKLLGSITYYQLLQSHPRLDTDMGRGALQSLIQELDAGNCVQLSYGYKNLFGQSGHAIVACEYEKESDGSYTVQLYDENCAPDHERFIEMSVSKDLTKFSFTDANGNKISEKNCLYIEVTTYEEMASVAAAPYGSMTAQGDGLVTLVLPMWTDYVLANSDGERLMYSAATGQFAGDMDYYSTRLLAQEEDSQLLVTVEESDAFTVQERGDDFQINIYSDDDFAGLSGEGWDTAVLDLGDAITVESDGNSAYDFTAYLSTDVAVGSGETNLIEISAKATAATEISVDNDAGQVKAVSEAPLTGGKMYALAGTDTEALTDLSADADNELTVSTSAPGTELYTISISAGPNGRVWAKPETAAPGTQVTLTATPDVGYVLASLKVTDADGQEISFKAAGKDSYTFTMPKGDVTVKATFEQEGWKNPYSDVSSNNWYYEAVQYVTEKGLMEGIGGGLFAPNTELNRAMLVTILYRLEGQPEAASANFTDVPGSSWYASAVNWAAANKIVEGYPDGTFAPTKSLTREEMATILYRYAAYKGYDTTATGDLSGFADGASVSSWAETAVIWAVDQGVISGMGGNVLNPKGTATRAQVAQVLMNYLENLEK
jgi:hypothetical protein